jgi:phage terminase large subunit GpA-like protein
MNRISQQVHIPHERVVEIYDHIQGLIDGLPSMIPDIKVSEFAEQYRVLPRGTPYPGPWRNARTPYLTEIMDELSATSKTQEVVFMKGAQLGATAGPIENFVGYVIKCVPAPILFVTANQDLLSKWTTKRLGPLLMSCGLDGKIEAQHQMKGQRTTGNKMFSKEFPGGSLDMATAGSAAGLRSDSIRYLCLDEVDGYKSDVDGEGNPVSIARARTKAWKKRKKILYISTPTTMDESHINPLFMSGDQRKYLVPCPECKTHQELVFGSDDTEYGLKWGTKNGKLDRDSVRYVCRKCKCKIPETKKFEMVQKGRWVPTAISSSETLKSYHLSALYSNMEEWPNIVANYLKGLDDPGEMRSHVNLDLGLPYQEKGRRPSKDKVISLRGNYDEAEVPDGVLYLTMAIDVQRGSQKEGKLPARLECEVLGHCKGYRTKSIAYLVFNGDVNSLDSFGVALCLIDSRYQTDTVYDFCGSPNWNNTYPLMGMRYILKSSATKDRRNKDESSPMDRIKYRAKSLPESGMTLWEISTVHYKDRIYRAMELERRPLEPQRSGYMDHPAQYPDEYFEQLRAEEAATDEHGIRFYRKTRERNEALDLKVYNMAAGAIYLNSLVENMKMMAKAYAQENGQKINPLEMIAINYNKALDMLEKQTAPRRIATS